ncbi:MAG: hypothetical protein O9972_50375 [Burkholderiales bacterium]|nr:hypothetical protein [Burkholderiales bacterium]
MTVASDRARRCAIRSSDAPCSTNHGTSACRADRPSSVAVTARPPTASSSGSSVTPPVGGAPTASVTLIAAMPSARSAG